MASVSTRLCLPFLAALAVAGALAGCGSGSPADAAGRGEGAQESVAVITAPVVSKAIAVEVEALGTARANEAVEVTSKAANMVVAVRFKEGQLVRRGQLLVELDGAQARADVEAAQAALAATCSRNRRCRRPSSRRSRRHSAPTRHASPRRAHGSPTRRSARPSTGARDSVASASARS